MTSPHDAARQAALDARDRVAPHLSDYTALTIAEAAIAAHNNQPWQPHQPTIIDAHSDEPTNHDDTPTGTFDDVEPRYLARDVANKGRWL